MFLCIYAGDIKQQQQNPTLELRLIIADKENRSLKLRQKELKSVRERGGPLVASVPDSFQPRLGKHDILIITERVIGDHKHSVALMTFPE